MDKVKNYAQLKKYCIQRGSSFFGVADVSQAKKDFLIRPQSLEGVDCAISLGARLSDGVLSEIEGSPTRLYFHHYKTANMFLDQLAFMVGAYLQTKGYRAIPIPASQILDWQQQKGHVAHKRMAQMAGIGWIGRNNLLVTKQFGAQVRLVTVLTDMPLKTDKPAKAGCGDCRLCISACPAGAIKEDPKDFDHQGCFGQLKQFQKQRLTDQYICGVCVNVCKGGKGDG